MNEAPLEILYRDSDYIAIHKPSGMLVHRTNLDPSNSMAAMPILTKQVGQKVFPVHRLDRPTSGVLLFALSSEAARLISKKFEDREVKKTYRAVVRGHFAKSVDLDYPLQEELDEYSDAKARWQKAPQEAQSLFIPLATIELPFRVDRYPTTRYSLVEAIPTTGRKHQIRRHLAHLRHPVIGDVNHGVGAHNRFFQEHFGIQRLLLACTQLSFLHPMSGGQIKIQAHLAVELEDLLQKLGWGKYV